MMTTSKPNKRRLSVVALRVKGVNIRLSLWQELALILKRT